MSDAERTVLVFAIATLVLFVTVTLLLLLLRLAPKAVQQRVVTASARWNETMFRFIGRASYPFAVLMVVTIGLSLIGAVALLFAPR